MHNLWQHIRARTLLLYIVADFMAKRFGEWEKKPIFAVA